MNNEALDLFYSCNQIFPSTYKLVQDLAFRGLVWTDLSFDQKNELMSSLFDELSDNEIFSIFSMEDIKKHSSRIIKGEEFSSEDFQTYLTAEMKWRYTDYINIMFDKAINDLEVNQMSCEQYVDEFFDGYRGF